MAAPFLSKKLSSSRIVWFGLSNQWVHFEEPAWYVYSQIRKSRSIEDIARNCVSRYGLSLEESLRFTGEIKAALAELEKPLQAEPISLLSAEIISTLSFTPYSTRHYRMKDKSISIAFGSRTAEYYIHPPFAHLETEVVLSNDAHFEIFEHKGMPIIRKKGEPAFSSSAEDFNRVKKRLSIELVNIIYQKTNDSWMSFLHASGISNENETILLSSASGSGKSTMAALLQARGLRLVSDDFIPIDADRKHAWPFPAAISVKEGAFDLLSDYYGNLRDKDYNLYPYTHPSIRYLIPEPYSKKHYKSLPVHTLIFIHYNPEVQCALTPLSVPEALKLFHEQAWVSHNPQFARKFINWFIGLRCFRLEYSDNEKGMGAILDKFK